jgi:hypothetical protein
MHDLARNVLTPQQPIQSHSLANDPIQNLRHITENVTSLARSMEVGPNQELELNTRLMDSWVGLLYQFDIDNGLTQSNVNNAETKANEDDA